MKLIIVRHGETVENVTGITQGHAHGTLSDKGVEQAKKVALRLKDEKIDYVYSSDLNRAKQTTEEIIRYHQDIPVEYSKELRERGKGKFDGKPRKLAIDAAKKADVHYDKYRFGDGESMSDVKKRILKFFDKLFAEHKRQIVLVVSHGGAMSCLFTNIENKGLESSGDYSTKNTSVTIIDDISEKPKIRLFDCIEHLNENK